MTEDLKIRAITICVDYADILAMTLPTHKFFVDQTLVVTTGRDTKTIDVAQANGAQVHVTDTFYRRGAHFNKFGALEEGLDVLGRDGWLLIIDSDIAIPENRHPFIPQIGKIYTPHRRIKEDLDGGIPEQRKWTQYKRPRVNEEFAAYFLLFHGSDPALGRPPWHSVNWRWAGNADTTFYDKWMPTNKTRPPWEVLHLGPPFVNWAGRVSKYADGTYDPETKSREEKRDMMLRARKVEGPLGRFRKERLEAE